MIRKETIVEALNFSLIIQIILKYFIRIILLLIIIFYKDKKVNSKKTKFYKIVPYKVSSYNLSFMDHI